jgi:hypothetical protein
VMVAAEEQKVALGCRQLLLNIPPNADIDPIRYF